MSELILDRHGRLQDTPAFLAPVGERERSLGRLAGFVVLVPVLAVITIALVLTVVMGVGAAILGADDGRSLMQALQTLNDSNRPGRTLLSYAYEFAAVGLGLFAAAAAIIAVAAKLYRRPMRSFITTAPRFRWRLAALGMAVAAPLIGLALLAELSWGETAIEPPILRATGVLDAAGYIAIAAVCLFLAALAEEMVFRGWLLQQTGAFTRSVPILLAVNGLLFALVHFDPDPGAFAVRATMGAGWAWIALRLGGLEFATGAHLANNLIVSVLAQPLALTPPTAAETADPRSVLVQFAVVLITVAVVELALRNKRGRFVAAD